MNWKWHCVNMQFSDTIGNEHLNHNQSCFRQHFEVVHPNGVRTHKPVCYQESLHGFYLTA